MWQTFKEWELLIFDMGTVSMERSSGSCESWVEFWREGEPGGSCGLEGHLLRDLDKGFRRDEKKGKNRERGEGEPSFFEGSGRKKASKGDCYGVGQPGESFILSLILTY